MQQVVDFTLCNPILSHIRAPGYISGFFFFDGPCSSSFKLLVRAFYLPSLYVLRGMLSVSIDCPFSVAHLCFLLRLSIRNWSSE